MHDTTKKVAIVTGGSQGIGEAAAKKLAAEASALPWLPARTGRRLARLRKPSKPKGAMRQALHATSVIPTPPAGLSRRSTTRLVVSTSW